MTTAKSKNQAYDSVIASRHELERNFVAAAVTGICTKTINASDLLAICPLDMLTPGTVPYAILWAVNGLLRADMPITVPAIWEYLVSCSSGPIEASFQLPRGMTAADVSDLAWSPHGRSVDAIYFYAKKMRDEGLKRIAENELYGILSDSRRYGNSLDDVTNGLKSLIDRLHGSTPEVCDLGHIMRQVIENLDAQIKPLATPWPRLNAVLKGGLAPGELAVLAARPGMGKTAFAGCLAVETARSGVPVLFISREVKDTTLASRFLSREGRIDARFFREGVANTENILPKIKEAAAELSSLPLRIVEKSIAPMTPSEVRRLAKNTKDVGLIIIDYLQLLNPENRQLSREREVADMSRSIKQLALDCDCPVLLLSQLNRASEEGNREPRLSDLRESGAIEQDADIVIFLHTAKGNERASRMPVKLIVAKGRSSGTGVTSLVFNKPFADFEENNHDDVFLDDINNAKRNNSL